jgi:septum formation protein
MTKTNLPIYLASRSPRRKKLLKILDLNFKSFSVEFNEVINDGEHPVTTVKRLARGKMKAAKERVAEGLIITADTIVVLDKKIIGKPKNKKDAAKILRRLSGKTHTVFTGFAIYNSSKEKTVVDYESTKVTFRSLADKEIKEYVDTGSPMDKAGAYGIQDDFGAVFVKKINGCYYNVVGLPLFKLHSRLKEVL